MYPKDAFIEGHFNAHEHAQYLWSLFSLLGHLPSNLIDFGFGTGELLRQVSQRLSLKDVSGIDISDYALKRLKRQAYAKNWHLYKTAIHLWKSSQIYDLGLCNSVLQYVKDEDMETTVASMAQHCQFLYFHIPTLEDYQNLRRVLNFQDPYAYERPKAFYHAHLLKHFNIVAWGVLESKMHRQGSPFTDAFYRS